MLTLLLMKMLLDSKRQSSSFSNFNRTN